MNRILTYGIAAVATTILSQPIYANDKGGGHGGGGGGARGGGGGGAKAQFSAPAARGNFGSMRAQSAPHFSPQSRSQFNNAAFGGRSRSNAAFAPSVVQNRSFAPSVPRSRAFVQPQQRNAPSIAFGGSAFNNANSNRNALINARNARTFAGTTSGGFRGNTQAFRAPGEVSRGWDRGHEHMWNHHHYRWSGGDWVIIDSGAYGYPYGYDNGYNGYDDNSDQPAVAYSSPAYANDSASSESVAMSVQDRLARLGYSPGPVDGVIGPQTRDAIADFQNDRHLPVTGDIDGNVLRALGL